ncbi:MAG: hypothetical protein PHP06_02735 [Clostridia bacterium]|nr:hypothetical protein [Clostridia bacterium]
MNNQDKVLSLLEQLQNNISIVQKDIKGLKTSQTEMQEGIKGLKTSQVEMQEGIKGLKISQVEMQEDIDDIKSTVHGIEDQFRDLESRNANRHMDIIAQIKEMKSDISRIEINTAENWRDIAKLKSIK